MVRSRAFHMYQRMTWLVACILMLLLSWVFTTQTVVYGQTSCPHTQSGLILLSSLPQWNVANADLKITQPVKVDQSPGVLLRSITVERGGELIFDNVNLKLNVEYILVKSGAKFIAGSATCPITSKIVITFYGNRTTENVIGSDPYDNTASGSKGFVAWSGSYLQLYGDVNRPTWTNLAEIAWKGNSTIQVMESTQWKVGDKLLITSTDYGELIDNSKGSGPSWMYVYKTNAFPDQNEERTIVQVINSKTFVLDRPLNFTHWGKDYARAEVAVLNRNIVFQGDDSSLNTQFGGHFMIRVLEQVEISGIEVTRMGQKGVLGRYSVHFHVLADQSFNKEQPFFIKDSSIHHSFQRCVVVHDSNGLLIQDNVCFDSFGHQYFLEDGGEMGNQFIHNLGVRPKPVANGDPLQIIPSDHDVAVFWITNPNNTWVKNAAVGGRFPFWFTMPLNVGGISSAKYGISNYYIRPRSQPLGEFKYNVAHSSNGNGFQVDDMLKPDGTTELSGYSPRMGPYGYNVNPSGSSVDALFDSLIAYKNRGYGVWARGGPMVFKNISSFDNRIAMNSPPGPSIIMDSVFTAETDNAGEPWRATDQGGRSRPDFSGTTTLTTLKGYETYDNGGPQILVNVTFRNYVPNKWRQAGALGQLTDGPFKHQTLNRYSNLKFENSNRVFIHTGYYDNNKGTTLLDLDGSTTGLKPGGWIVSNDSILTHAACSVQPDWRGYSCPVSLEGYAQLSITNIGGEFITTTPFGSDPRLANLGVRIPRMIVHDLTRNVSSAVLGARASQTTDHIMHSNVILRNFYAIRWVINMPTPPVLRIGIPSSMNNDWIVVTLQYPRTASLYIYTTANNVEKPLRPVNSLEELVQDPTTYYYDEKGEHLYLYLRNRIGRGWSERWGFPFYSYDGNYVYVNTTCPNRVCSVDRYDLPTNAQYFTKMYHREDRFAGVLKPVVNGARGNGVILAALLPNKKTLDVVVHHDLTLVAKELKFGLGDPKTGVEERYLGQPGVKYSPYSISRFSLDLSVDDLIAVLKGRFFVKLSTSEYPDGHLKGHLYCNQETNAKGEYMCSLPPPVAAAQPCDPAPPDAYHIYNEANDPSQKTGWYFSYYNHSADVAMGVYSIGSRNYTTAPICGESSLFFGLQRGGAVFGKVFSPTDPRYPANIINLSVYKYYEFFVKALTPGELRLNVYFTEVRDNTQRDTTSLPVDPKYVQHFKMDHTRVTRVRIPVTDLPFTNRTSLNAIQRVGFLVSGGVYREFLIDNIRFVKEDVDTFVAPGDIQQSQVVGLQVEGVNPDPDPLRMRQHLESIPVIPVESSAPVQPKTSNSKRATPSTSNANSKMLGYMLTLKNQILLCVFMGILAIMM
ncbi:hypothetical protein C9374_010443 [Naegleria lovaniensis]|uniref:G8 domain-containing protein n=1 Tax=Naegleria lovaniensis TaxID=51637 RepID=A0AA88GHJ2_NAELO|nr:uncharacterized protein C9374_010443 [Naegleria lovaniensis]KAG2374699.1 hypothetical protein C9374_010443 [Naegleria lovaniensis]